MDYKENIASLEKKYSKNKTVKNAIVLVCRYRGLYKFSKNRIFIKKALIIINERLMENNLDARLILYKAYFSYLDSDMQEYTKYLKIIKQSKKYFSENDIDLYLQYLHISGIGENAEKSIQMLLKYTDKYGQASCYISDIYAEEQNFSKSYEYTAKAIGKGIRNPIVFENLHRYFVNARECKDSYKLIFKLLNWCITHKIDIEELVKNQSLNIGKQIKNNIEVAKKIYKIQDEDYILEELSQALIDFEYKDQEAFLLYSKAAKKQINIKDLNKMLILSSFENSYENISYFFMKKFLEEEKLSIDIKGFIYHLLINKENLNQLLDENNMDIVSYCIFAIDNKYTDMYNLSIYKYCLLNQEKFNISEKYILYMEKILYENLFSYEVKVNNSEIKFVGIKEYEKKQLSFFSIVNKKATVKSSTSEFFYYFVDEKKKNIIKEIATIKPMVYSLDIEIYIYFYNIGKRTPELLISCANYCLNNDINKTDLINILKDTEKIDGLTDEYKNKINMYIGSVYLNKNEYGQALTYFEKVNTYGLTGDYIEKILVVFLETKNYKKASKLLLINRLKISDGIIIYVLEKLASQKDVKIDYEIVNISYNMIMKGNFNIQLINLVLTDYVTTLDELLEFQILLNKKNIFNKTLAEKILIASIKNRVLNPTIEDVFVKLFDHVNLDKTIKDYVSYIAFEVIKNHYIINDSVLSVLENIYSYNKWALFTLTISYYYKNILNYDIIQIGISEMEKQNILMPILKEDFYSNYSEYVNKYEPFIYHSEKNKIVYFYYKLNDDNIFKKEVMEYFAFGIFISKVIMFFNDKIEYYFEEIQKNGSITTEIKSYVNKNNKIKNNVNEYTTINNGYILKSEFKYNEVEQIINKLTSFERNIVGELLEGE